jgi:hypothetical protein
MVNLLTNRNISAAYGCVSGKAAAQTLGGKTFRDALGETIRARSAADGELAAHDAVQDAETPVYTEQPREIRQFEDVYLNGRWYRQMTDEYLTHLGYDVEVLQANDIGEDRWKYAGSDGVVPRYIIPLDMTNETNYATTLATPENLARTAANNGVDSPAVSGNARVREPEAVAEESPAAAPVEESGASRDQNVENLNRTAVSSAYVDILAPKAAVVTETAGQAPGLTQNLSQNHALRSLQNISLLRSADSAVSAWVMQVLSDLNMLRAAENRGR